MERILLGPKKSKPKQIKKINKGKMSFSSLKYHKSSLFILELSEVLFSFLNFAKRSNFRLSICVR